VSDPHHYPLCMPVYPLGLDACFYRDKLKWNETYPHKLVAAAWMRILLTFSVFYVSDASQHHDRDFTLLLEMWQKLRTQILYNSFPRFSPNCYVLIYTHCWELDSHGRLSLLFVLKVIVWHFVTLIRIWLHSLSCYLPNCCHGDFSAIS